MKKFIIKDFEPAFVPDAEKILKEEYSAEKKKVPSLPEESPAGLLNWLSTKKYKKAAFCGGRIVGYMMFTDVWDGFFGLCKGSFSPLGGSAVSFELGAEREKVMLLLFEGRALVSCLSKILEKEGAEFLGVDYETLNPTALRFWTKYFSPYTYSFHRRIDERIAHYLK